MSFLLVLIGNKYTTDAEETVEWHLEPGHHAFWTNVQHPSWAKVTRLVAKVVRVGVLGLPGTLHCIAPIYDPLTDATCVGTGATTFAGTNARRP